MLTYRPLSACAIALLLTAGTAAAQKVSYDYSRSHDFGSLKTFAFHDGANEETVTEQTTTYDSPLVEERTRQAVARQLIGRGLREDPSNPDAYVRVRRTYRTEQIVYGGGPYYGYGYGYGWGGYGGPWYTEEIIKGSLIVDLESKDGMLLWRGIKDNTVHPRRSPEKRSEKVREEVAKIFEKFPGRPEAVGTSGYDVPERHDGEGGR